MKFIKSILLLFFLILHSCNSQTNPKTEIHNKDFNWTITIPENFENVSAEDWKKIQNKGEQAIEDTYKEDIINQATTIFVFRNGQSNVLESNYQPFDPKVDGSYLESWKNVNDVLYETFKTQLPKAKIVQKDLKEKIDNLEFNVHTMEVEMPNKMVLTTMMFSRLFDKQEFTVNIMYVDKLQGNAMLNSWRKSKFGK